MGVGISGEEGLQAVNSSDYAIAQVNLFGHNVSAPQTAYFGLVTVPFPETFAPCSWALVICTEREHVGLFLYSVILGNSIQSNRILNFFYKNIVCIGVLWWFQIYCFWSSALYVDFPFCLNAEWVLIYCSQVYSNIPTSYSGTHSGRLRLSLVLACLIA